MPGSRQLAELLQVHRKTVVSAYEELLLQGWISSVPSSGTYVSEKLPLLNYRELPERQTPGAMPEDPGFSLRPLGFADKPVMINHKILTINDGFPDERLAPSSLIGKAYRNVIGRGTSRSILSYTDVEGSAALREALAGYLNDSRGLNIGRENILITRGSQMGVYLAAKTILIPGDNVVVGETNYFVANMAFKSLGATLLTVPVTETGLDIDALASLCAKTAIRAVFVTSHHHHPTTVTLSAEKRMKLLQLAERHRFAIIEDDYDYDFHYSGSPLLPLSSADRGGYSIYIGSFSKTIAPFIRTGYVVAPRNLIREIARVRRIIDRQGDAVLEQALAELIRGGDIRRHLNKTLRVYRLRRDHFCSLLTELLGNAVSFKAPEGGMAVWTKFNEDISFDQLVAEAAKKGLHVNHASVYNPAGRNLNATRLGFCSLTETEAEKALAILSDAVQCCLRK